MADDFLKNCGSGHTGTNNTQKASQPKFVMSNKPYIRKNNVLIDKALT